MRPECNPSKWHAEWELVINDLDRFRRFYDLREGDGYGSIVRLKSVLPTAVDATGRSETVGVADGAVFKGDAVRRDCGDAIYEKNEMMNGSAEP